MPRQKIMDIWLSNIMQYCCICLWKIIEHAWPNWVGDILLQHGFQVIEWGERFVHGQQMCQYCKIGVIPCIVWLQSKCWGERSGLKLLLQNSTIWWPQDIFYNTCTGTNLPVTIQIITTYRSKGDFRVGSYSYSNDTMKHTKYCGYTGIHMMTTSYTTYIKFTYLHNETSKIWQVLVDEILHSPGLLVSA